MDKATLADIGTAFTNIGANIAKQVKSARCNTDPQDSAVAHGRKIAEVFEDCVNSEVVRRRAEGREELAGSIAALATGSFHRILTMGH